MKIYKMKNETRQIFGSLNHQAMQEAMGFI